MCKLKTHLLPRVKSALEQELYSNSSFGGLGTPNPSNWSTNTVTASSDNNIEGLDQLYFKNDRIYKHRIIRINYTTYDIRRAEHVINPRTAHSCIMVLADRVSELDAQECQSHDNFWYGRVLGIYHANVIYTGPGMRDYKPRTFQFLWVRWFRNVDPVEWGTQHLQRVAFPPTASEDAFGFLDPADVVRCCHILPQFMAGHVHLDGIGLSRLANDNQDWRMYYVNRSGIHCLLFHVSKLKNTFSGRFVDRDMLMRCYWGMGIGHTYAGSAAKSSAADGINSDDGDMEVVDTDGGEGSGGGGAGGGEENSGGGGGDGGEGNGGGADLHNDDNDPELGLEDRDTDASNSDESDEDPHDEDSQDGELEEHIDTYGEDYGL